MYAFYYLGDIIIPGRTIEELSNNLRKVFQRFKDTKSRLDPWKCVLADGIGIIGTCDVIRICPRQFGENQGG